jgi:hypothetical protein
MGWPASLLVALLSGALGLVVGGLVMNACVGSCRVSDFEGKAGCAVVALTAPQPPSIPRLVVESRRCASSHC